MEIFYKSNCNQFSWVIHVIVIGISSDSPLEELNANLVSWFESDSIGVDVTRIRINC